MIKSIKTALSALGTTSEGYLQLLQNHAKAWQVEQAIEQSFSHKEHVAEIALKMSKLANQLADIDEGVIIETNKMIEEVLTKRGLMK